MSTELYNRFTVSDLDGIENPYVNSSLEFGFFGNIGAATANTWNSMPTNLSTNNGIATVDASGLRIFSPGIYTLNVSIDFATAAATQAFFCFTTSKQVDSANVSDTFGGVETSGMFSFGSNSTTYPGIISWTTNAYNIGNILGSKLLISTTNRLIYSYAFTNTTGTFRQGICTTKITFIIDEPTTIYFNTFCAVALTMGNSYFTLQLIYKLSYIYNFIQSNSISAAWTGIATSSTGQYVYACVNDGRLYKSSDYGASWITWGPNGNYTYRSITVSNDGSRICVCTFAGFSHFIAVYDINGTQVYSQVFSNPYPVFVSTAMSPDGRDVFVVSNSGFLYYLLGSTGSVSFATRSITSSLGVVVIASSAQLLFYSSATTLLKSSYSGTNIATLNTPVTSPAISWRGIATDITGTYLCAVASGATTGGGIYTSSNGGNRWVSRIADGGNWTFIASSYNGSVLAATKNSGTTAIVKVSTDYGFSWKDSSIIPQANSITVSGDGKTICVACNPGALYYAVGSVIN